MAVKTKDQEIDGYKLSKHVSASKCDFANVVFSSGF